MEDIADVDHRHAKRVFKNLNKNLRDYHDLYVQRDTLFLQMCLKILELNVLKYMH